MRNEEEVNNIFFAYQVIIIKLRVAGPDSHYFGKPDPVPGPHWKLERNAGSGNRISTKVKIQEL